MNDRQSCPVSEEDISLVVEMSCNIGIKGGLVSLNTDKGSIEI